MNKKRKLLIWLVNKLIPFLICYFLLNYLMTHLPDFIRSVKNQSK